MHQLHTTPAFVLGHYEHGESSRVYKLLTRDLGLLYAHAQGVRELRNRNRFALATHGQVQVTLVRGRQVWRLTSARSESCACAPRVRRALTLAGSLLAPDDPAPRIYTILALADTHDTAGAAPAVGATYEALVALLLLHELGYVARPRSSLVDEVLQSTDSYLEIAHRLVERHQELVASVNAALHDLPGRVLR